MLYNIALDIQRRKITITSFMASILINILEKKQTHLQFWDTVKNMIHESFGTELKEFLHNELLLTYKYTMINLGNNTFSGYWIDPSENTEGVEPHDLDQAINDHVNSTTPPKIIDEIMTLLRYHNYTGDNNLSSTVSFIKALGSPSDKILYKIPLVYTFSSKKYNDRLFITF